MTQPVWASRGLHLLLVALLVLSGLAAATIGVSDLRVKEVFEVLFHRLLNTSTTLTPIEQHIVLDLRMPRAVLAALCGAALGLGGVVMQALVRNPLADPYLMGVSSGASLGAVLALSTGMFAFAGLLGVQVAAFLGALLSLGVVLLVSQGRESSTFRLILGGIAVSYVFSGLTSLLVLTGDSRELARSVMSWLMGSFAGARWEELLIPALVILVLGMFLLVQHRSLNAISLGDDTARSVGFEVHRLRLTLMVTVSLLTSVVVAISGSVGFVGLVIPHLTRFLVGVNHKHVLPLSVLLGAVLMVWVDVAARTLFTPLELPVGVITSLLGAPMFIWVMVRHQHRTAA